MKAVLLALLLCVAAAAQAELRPFSTDSLAAIEQRHAGRPFILAFWSVNCSHCLGELRPLGQLARRQGLALELVSADSDDDAPLIRAALEQAGLAAMDAWVFDDPVPERLQYAIDPAWHGELPRSYLYDAAHRRETVSGVLGEARLQAWLNRQVAPHNP